MTGAERDERVWGQFEFVFSDRYLEASLPAALDIRIREEVISAVESGGATALAELLECQWPVMVWAFGIRAASLAARTGNPRWLIAGALVGEWLASVHPHDVTTVLGSLARACSIAGIRDRDELLTSVADAIDAPQASSLRDIDALHPLDELGVAEEWDDDRFVRFAPATSF